MGFFSFLFGDHTKGKSGVSVSTPSAVNSNLENIKKEMKALKRDIELAKQNPSGLFEREVITASKTDDIREAVAHLREDATKIEKARVEEFLQAKQILEESLTIVRDAKDESTRDSSLELAKAKLDRLISYSESEDCPLEIGTEAVESIQTMIEELSGDRSSMTVQAQPHGEAETLSSRDKAYQEYVEYVLSTEALYKFTPEEYLEGWERRAELVVLPPDEWRISRDRNGNVEADANWKFLFQVKSEADWQVYLYSVKGHPELLKVGIAKDVLKRKEKYYSRCLKKWVMPRREAILVEELFKHATYGLHSTESPYWTVGNMQRETVLPEIEELWSEYGECSGFTEIRKISKDAAVATIDQIFQDVHWKLKVDELLLKYGITLRRLSPPNAIRNDIIVPQLMWQLRPHESEMASDFSYVTDEEVRSGCEESSQEDEQAIWDQCWRPEDWA